MTTTTERKLWQSGDQSSRHSEAIAAIRDELRREAISMLRRRTGRRALLPALGLLSILAGVAMLVKTETQVVIVQGRDLTAVKTTIWAVGGEITHDLRVIRAVGARLSAKQIEEIEASGQVQRIHASRPLTLAPRSASLDGTIRLGRGGRERTRILAYYDAIADRTVSLPSESSPERTDPEGSDRQREEAHIAGERGDSVSSLSSPDVMGVAEQGDVVAVKTVDADGQGNQADLIRGIGWILANRNAYEIESLQLAFPALPSGSSWDDPLGQALMAAREAGIALVWAGEEALMPEPGHADSR